MAKLLFYSDLHIRPERIESCKLVLQRIGEIALGRKVDLIVNCGDTFNTRGLIRTACFDALYHQYKLWHVAGLRQAIVPGNHDQEDKDGTVHPMRVFSEFDGWFVADGPLLIKEFGLFCLPYMRHAQVEAALAAVPSAKAKGLVAAIHLGIIGAKRNDSNSDSDGIPVEWFSKFKHVFSGHYHFRNKVGNVQYIGSPFQQNFGESGQAKGVLLHDTVRGETEFVEIKGTPKHYDVKVEWIDEKKKISGDVAQVTENDYVRVDVVGDAEQCSKIDKEAIGLKCRDLAFRRQIRTKSFSRLNLSPSDVMNISQLMDKYVDFVDVDLDRKKLKKIGTEFAGG